VPRVSGALGFTLKTPPEDRYLATSSDIRGSIAVLLAGRAAERLVFDEVSSRILCKVGFCKNESFRVRFEPASRTIGSP
jgi:hypothetical protein